MRISQIQVAVLLLNLQTYALRRTMPSPPPSPSNKKRTNHLLVLEELSVVSGFLTLIRNKLDAISRTQESFKLNYEEEKRLLPLFNHRGVEVGIAAGVASMLLLRRTRMTSLRRLQQRQHRSTNPPQDSAHVRNSPFKSPIPPGSSLPPPLMMDPGKQRRATSSTGALGWLCDGGLSFSVAAATSWLWDNGLSFLVTATTSFWYTNTKTKVKLQVLTELPLLEGGSRVADEFCPVVLEELDRLQKEQEQEEQDKLVEGDTVHEQEHDKSNGVQELSDGSLQWRGQPVQTIYLKTILQFAENCKTVRQNSSGQLKQQQEDFYDPSQDLTGDADWTESSMTDEKDNRRQ
jgi:hypothetical protein